MDKLIIQAILDINKTAGIPLSHLNFQSQVKEQDTSWLLLIHWSWWEMELKVRTVKSRSQPTIFHEIYDDNQALFFRANRNSKQKQFVNMGTLYTVNAGSCLLAYTKRKFKIYISWPTTCARACIINSPLRKINVICKSAFKQKLGKKQQQHHHHQPATAVLCHAVNGLGKLLEIYLPTTRKLWRQHLLRNHNALT